MLWSDFYDKIYDWADSTKKTRISSLEDIGSGDEVVDAVLEIQDEKIRAQLIRKAMKLGVQLTSDDYMYLDGEIPDDLYEQLGKYCGFENNEEDYSIEEESQPHRDSVGFFGALFAAILGDSGHSHKDNGYCDGDCANCPAHYGYRYGRWYYGHGHQHGCERHGNGGRSGKTYRD